MGFEAQDVGCLKPPDFISSMNSYISYFTRAILSKDYGTEHVLTGSEGNLNLSMTTFFGWQWVFCSVSNEVYNQSFDSSSNRELITSWRNVLWVFFFFLSPQQIRVLSEYFFSEVTTYFIYTRGHALCYSNKSTIISFNFQNHLKI